MYRLSDALQRNRVRRSLLFAILAISNTYVCAQSQDANAFRGAAKAVGGYSSDPVVLMRPGIFIDPTFDQTETESTAPYQTLFNQTEAFSLLYTPSRTTLSDLYKQILTTAQWAKVPLVSGQRDELTTDRQKLYKTDGNRSAGYQNYLDKKKIHDGLVAKWEATPESARTAELADQVQASQEDLELLGHSNIYGPAESRYRLLSEEASYKWRDDDISIYSKAASTSGISSDVEVAFDHLDNAPWTHLVISGDQLTATATEIPLGGAVDLSLPWWSWTGTVPTAQGCIHFPSDPFTVQFDMALLHLARAWYDPHVFESRAWRLDSILQPISDGDDVHNSGTSPLYSNGVLIIRNLLISGKGIGQCTPQIRAAIRKHEQIGFGPFQLSGSALQGSPFYLPATVTSSSIQIPYYQIVGLTTSLLPKTPNPNSDFLWP